MEIVFHAYNQVPDDTPAQLTRSTRFDNFFEFPYLCGDILAWVNFLSTGQLGGNHAPRCPPGPSSEKKQKSPNYFTIYTIGKSAKN